MPDDHSPIDQLLIDLLQPSQHTPDLIALVKHLYNRPGPQQSLLQRAERHRHRKNTTPMWLQAVRTLIDRAEDGDTLAMFQLGRWNRLGIGMDEDIEQATQWYEMGAENGHTGCILNLAHLCVAHDEQQARTWLQKAQDLGDPATHALWALCFPDQAAEQLALGAQKQDPYTLMLYSDHLLKQSASSNQTQALKLLHQAAQAHVTEAAIRLAHLHEQGLHGVPADLQLATHWALKAANLGHPFGCGFYGRLISERDPAEAIRQMRRGALLGEHFFNEELGHLLMAEGKRPGDLREAVHWWRVGAEQGHANAMSTYADALYQGRGCKADPQTALAWDEKAAALGRAQSQISLGVALMNGHHTPADPARAFNLFVLASLQEDPHALYLQGKAWDQGDGTPQDPTQAYRCYLKAAEMGLPKAAYAVGMAHIWGEGTTKDIAAGAKWLSRAAEAGYSHAQVYLGMMFLYGHGVSKSLRRAKHWLQQAVEQSNPAGMREMALLLQEEDEETHRDEIRRLMSTAAAHGEPAALKWIQERWPEPPQWLTQLTGQRQSNSSDSSEQM